MLKLPESDIWHYLASCRRPIVLYGMGNGADKIVKQLKKYSLYPSGVFASNDFVRGHTFLDMPVLTFDEARKRFPDMVALVSFGTSLPEVTERIKRLDAEVYAPDVPVFGDTVFTIEYAREHFDELEYVYSRLADEKSRDTFSENLMFKLDGKISRLTKSETAKEEMYSLLQLNNTERYLDLGAFNGDTIREFLQVVSGYESITALEPDGRNYKKLAQYAENLKSVSLYNAAVGEKIGEAMFSSSGGRKSRIGGNTPVRVLTVDSLGADFTYIKADVEGEEQNMLMGAGENISRGAKLRIAAYHRSEDIFALPLYVLSLNPRYKLFMRHLPYIPAWDTDFIFV